MRIGNIVWNITIFLTVAFAFSLKAQNTDSRKTAFSARAIILGYEVLEGDDPLALKDYNSGFEVGIHRVLTDHIQLHVPIRVANIKYLDSIGKVGTFGIDAQLQYHFNDTIKTINPYISAGAGFMQAENNNHVTFPLGAGIDIRISESAVIGLKADYRLSVEDNKNALAFGIGFKKWIGKNDKKEMPIEVTPIIDTDNDGIEDELDLCPEIAGLKEFQGCPDTDGDGIPDYQDICPEFPGSKEFGGCPDTDGDGIPDNLDECPQIAGTSANNGCPTQDMDGDGIPDKEDECPESAGTLANRGCPDKDGDGVIDKEDLCPDSYGTAANYGCPEIEKEEKETLNLAMDAVQFETGEANLKAESFNILNDIAKILKKYPDYYLRITGHTDNVGRESSNQILSEKRARACYEYLASRGINVSRMSYVGIGETRPRATNDTADGRYKNRRVEFSLYIPR